MVKVYTVEGCPYCEKVKKYLKSKDVEFEELDVEKNADARAACIKLTGIDGAVPVTTIDGENYVLDFDKKEIDKLLCLQEGFILVKVYSFETCPWCSKVKKYLDSKGVEYEVRDIELNEEYAKECLQISGDTMVPVTTIDGKKFVLGFDKAKIDELLAG